MSSNNGFFAVDRRAWARTCDLGLNSAVAYLVLARGTGPDNRTTSWSDNAIEKYTGLSWGRTNKARAELKASGLYREDKGGTKPRYHLQPAHKVSGCEGYTAPLTDLEQKLLNYLGFCYRIPPLRAALSGLG